MKTNQVLTRKMGAFDVLQRSSDGKFDSNVLLKQWNCVHPDKRKNMSDFLNAKSTKEFIESIEIKESHNRNFCYADSQAIIRINGRQTKKGRTLDQVWMHPFLFIDFSMWLNPSFKYDVIKFVYDEMIKYRKDAGDSYREMTGALKNIISPSFLPLAIQNIARALNHVVFGSHESKIRNKIAEECLMRELADLEKDITKFIDNGFIRSYDQIIDYLRREWCKKWQPKILSR